MKIAICTISKNESKFVKRFMNSVKDADYIIIGDTGSTDNTVELLEKEGAKVYNINVDPWRFDKARNKVLEYIPDDVDLIFSIDLDEVVSPSNWRDLIEKIWNENKDCHQLTYNYNWSHLPNGKSDVSFIYEKIHTKDLTWKHPVHEVLVPINSNLQLKKVFVPNLVVDHYPDPTKSRSSYLPLLELSVKEDPLNDRNVHYLAREYYFHKKYDLAIEMFINHLNLSTAQWDSERSASCRYIAKCITEKNGSINDTELWLFRSTFEAPNEREGWIELSLFFMSQCKWKFALLAAKNAYDIKEKLYNSYLCTRYAWEEGPADLLSVIYWNLGNKHLAKHFVNEAYSLNPNDERIKNNYNFFKGV